MLKRITLWCRLIKLRCQCRKLRRQRDCLRKFFFRYSAYDWFLAGEWDSRPDELVEVLEEMKEEK